MAMALLQLLDLVRETIDGYVGALPVGLMAPVESNSVAMADHSLDVLLILSREGLGRPVG